jgi:hypothetical protein
MGATDRITRDSPWRGPISCDEGPVRSAPWPRRRSSYEPASPKQARRAVDAGIASHGSRRAAGPCESASPGRMGGAAETPRGCGGRRGSCGTLAQGAAQRGTLPSETTPLAFRCAATPNCARSAGVPNRSTRSCWLVVCRAATRPFATAPPRSSRGRPMFVNRSRDASRSAAAAAAWRQNRSQPVPGRAQQARSRSPVRSRVRTCRPGIVASVVPTAIRTSMAKSIGRDYMEVEAPRLKTMNSPPPAARQPDGAQSEGDVPRGAENVSSRMRPSMNRVGDGL